MWVLATASLPAADPAQAAPADDGLFARTNLVAWCIVPFNAKKHGPEERATMLERLGFKLFAYDYLAEHIPTFDAEMEVLDRHHMRLFAWWFSGALNDEAKLILDVLKRHGLRDVQLWVTGGGEPTKDVAEQKARIESEAQRIHAIAEAAAKIGCTVACYNHSSWFGEPENQIAIIKHLRAAGITNVGIVYNLHHGHGRLDRFTELLQKMKPYLLALNLDRRQQARHAVWRRIRGVCAAANEAVITLLHSPGAIRRGFSAHYFSTDRAAPESRLRQRPDR